MKQNNILWEQSSLLWFFPPKWLFLRIHQKHQIQDKTNERWTDDLGTTTRLWEDFWHLIIRTVFPKVWSAKLSNLVRKKNETYQIVWKISVLAQHLFKLSILLLQISILRSADLFYQILWSANILFNVLWSASSKSLGNAVLDISY